MGRNYDGYTKVLQDLIEQIAALPGIGSRTAERLAYHLVREPKDKVLALSDAIRAIKEKVRNCSQCFNITEADTCPLCASEQRDRSLVCVVEQPRDLFQIEATGIYRGLYHVLLGTLKPRDGLGAEQLTVEPLYQRIMASQSQAVPIKEIILATNPTADGDATATYIQQRLQGTPVKISRLARGLPTGAQIEYSNLQILSDAMLERRTW